ncbi:MAG: 4-alpha-glucanotransferase [Thermodesulfobacteriota bacterium]
MNQRGSGLLLHITSLPSACGIGDLGPEAYRFADFLAKAGQRYWQILPFNPVDPLHGNSPYSSPSAFAGNTSLISPELLVQEGFLAAKDMTPRPRFPRGRCDFAGAVRYRNRLLENAWKKFNRQSRGRRAFDAFCGEQAPWLEDFALFVTLKHHFRGKPWNQWPEAIRDRNPKEMRALRKKISPRIRREKFCQYLFFRQWQALAAYCRTKDVRLIGDIPIYVGADSADTWANPGLFKLDEQGRPMVVSGVPPDYFCQTGQLWNNPVYDWAAHSKTRYRWWLDRMGHHFRLFDLVRIDHFRGLVACWEVPAGEKTAVNGKWVKAPAGDLLRAAKEKFSRLPLIAEDLGFITPDVRKIMARYRLPGMKILQFAFTGRNAEPSFLPHAYEKNCFAYTGTHDNNTVRGWFEEEATAGDRKMFFRYAGRKVPGKEIHWAFIRLAMMSAADTVILPVQDVLGLGAGARMNTPAVARGNWEWRLAPGQVTAAAADRLREMTEIYGRNAG